MIAPQIRARLYHAQYQDYVDDLPFWSALAAESGDPILEMGCGTGRIVSALASHGYRVIGLDSAAAMLHVAETTLAGGLPGKATWLEGDITSFSLTDPVRLAIGALNTFASLDDIQFCAALRSVRSNLLPGGLVALELPPFDPNPAAAIGEDDPLDVFLDPISGNNIELRARIDDQVEGQIRVAWLYDELHPDGRVMRHIWEETYFLRTLNHLRKLIQTCSFSVRSVYGDYDFTDHLPESERLLLVLEH